MGRKGDHPAVRPPGPVVLRRADLAARFRFAHTAIASSQPVPSSTLTWRGRTVGVHCLVRGEIYRRTSPQDGKSYAIGFDMRLREAWYGRFSCQPNSAMGGRIARALGGCSPEPATALPVPTTSAQGDCYNLPPWPS